MGIRKRTNPIIPSVVAAILSFFALWLMFVEYRAYRQTVLDSQDAQLFAVSYAVDRSLDIFLDQYCDSLVYVLHSPSFSQAEQLYLDTGNPSPLVERMRRSLMMQDDMALSLVAIDQSRQTVVASAASSFTYLHQPLQRGDVSVQLCQDRDGRFGLAFETQGADGALDYMVVLDLMTLYNRVSAGNTYDSIILLDSSQKVMIRATDCGEITVVDTGRAGPQDSRDVLFLTQLRATMDGALCQNEQATFFETPPCDDRAGYLARMAIYEQKPHEADFFTICVTMDYDQIANAMERNTIRIALYVAIIIAAFAHLISGLLQSDRRSRRAETEAESLRKRNETLANIRRQEQELAHHQRLQAIGTLTSGAAHEFNNLLTPIMGYSLLALEQVTDQSSELYDDLLEIYQAAQKSKDIVSRISSLSGKHMDLTFKPLNLDRVVQSVCTVLLPSKPPQVTLHQDLGCGPCRVSGSETHLSQVVLNLCINALHAMEPAGGILTLRSGIVRDETGRWAQLQVTDTGAGICQEDMGQIFEPFYTTKSAGKGCGLGLSIVRQILNEHGGTVRLQSQVGMGTTATVRLPVPTDSAQEKFQPCFESDDDTP